MWNVLLTVALAGAADAPIWVVEPQPRTVSIVVSGGVSEGAYLAGQLFAVTEAIKRGAGDRPPTVIVTGASAGSVGAVLTAIELLTHGAKPVEHPEDSVFWRLWVPFGITPDPASLFQLEGGGGDSLFNDTYVDQVLSALPDYARAATAASGTRPWWGDVYVGMQTTRLQPVPVGPASTLAEAFAFEMRLDEGVITGLPIRKSRGVEGTTPATLPEVARIARISGAFPGAFSFVTMACPDYDRWAFFDDRVCNVQHRFPDEVTMFDGGLYENNPVGLANDLATALNRTSAIIYLDPNLDWSPGQDPATCFGNQTFTSLGGGSQLLELAASVAGTFQKQGLSYQMEYHADRAILPVCQTTSPTSGYLASFLGFFDRSFRAGDFYLGMYDGFRFVDRNPQLFLDAPPPETLLGRRIEADIQGLYGLYRAAFESPEATAIRSQALAVDLRTARATARSIVRATMPTFSDPADFERVVRVTTLAGTEDTWGPDGGDPADLVPQMRVNLAILLRESLFRSLVNDPKVTRRELESSNLSANGRGFYGFLNTVDPEIQPSDLGLSSSSGFGDDALAIGDSIRFRPVDLQQSSIPDSFSESFLRTTRALAMSAVDLLDRQQLVGLWPQYAARALVGLRSKTFAQISTGADWNRIGVLTNFYPSETVGGKMEFSTSTWIRYGLGYGLSLKGTMGPHIDVQPGSRTVFGHKGLMIVPRLSAEVGWFDPSDPELDRGLSFAPGLEVAVYPISLLDLHISAAPWVLPLTRHPAWEPTRAWGIEAGLGVALPCLKTSRTNWRLCR